LYAYRCTQCGHRFEKIQSFHSEPERVCPVCQGALERPLTAPALQFKGAGWYVNDYAAKSSAPASESRPEGASEAGSEAGKGAASADTKTPSATGESSAGAPASAPGTAPGSSPPAS
jgi:putative FmdB family regulatory protein